ncbi:DUF1616 domain-containing protein [Streptomyces pinistramenti]|uniref:DUF1616 domain-containing protein n=1 Tax=Streptomyces pinistramenti TaxID=2884812 RepID=UPI001D063190|nr:DUF1616 domain-containing protein [Streptomyces pinistramenti]MCB5908060.1 DUF1616 domain-containing protein [Streptomyces pinistramenti]
MADQEKPPQPTGKAPGRLPEEDRHGFVSAFVGGVRPEGEQGKPGKRLVAIGIAVVVAIGVGALAVGALTSPDDKKNQADKVSPAAATGKADPRPKGQESPNGTTGGKGGNGGAGRQDITPEGRQDITPKGRQEIPAPDARDTTGSALTPPSPSTTATTTKAEKDKTLSRSAVPAFSALAGYGCPSNASAGIWTKDANFDKKEDGWLKTATGGYTGSGCTGRYLSVPMSGSATKYDPAQYVLWKFDYSAKIKGAASCRLAVYVPDNPKILYVGGSPAKYAIYDADRSGGTATGSFDIDQVRNRGKWLSPGSFKVTSGRVTVRMFNTGIDYTSSTKHAHDVAAPIQLSCTPA